MFKLLRQILADGRGASAVEYGLILALMVLAMMLGLSTFADAAIDMWDNVAENVQANA